MIVRVRFTMTIWIALAALCFNAAAVDDADLQLRFADGLMARGLHEHAIREYLIFQESNPDYHEMDVINYRIGEGYRQLGNLMAAVRAYNQVVDRVPRSAYRHRAMLRRADVYRLAGRHDIAVRQFRELLAEAGLDPALADAAKYWKGRGLVAKGDRSAALDVWRAFLETDRDSPFRQFIALELGKQLASGSDDEASQAITLLRQVAAEPPDERHGAEALFHLARLLERTGDDTAAAAAFDEFHKRYPNDMRAGEARLPAAWTYYRLGRYADSLRICRAVLQDGTAAEDDDAHRDQWWYLKANNHRQLENHASAVTAYAQLLEKWPKSKLAVSATIEMAQSEFRLGNHANALKTIRMLQRADAASLSALWLRAAAHDALGQDDDAVQHYRMIMERSPHSNEAYESTYRLARLFERRKDAIQAAAMFQLVAERYPERSQAPRALLAAAELMRSVERHAEAARDLARFLDRYPDHDLAETALYRKAVAETRLERHEIAIGSFQELLERFPDSQYKADAAFRLALLHFRNRDFATVDTVLELALQADPPSALRHRIVYRRALALQQLQRDSEAADLFKQLLDDPRPDQFDPPLLEWLIRQLRQEARTQDALRAANLLVDIAADQSAWKQVGHALAGLLALDSGNKEQAIERFEAALEVKDPTPYAAEAALRLGELLLEADRIADARRLFLQADAFARDPASMDLRAHALFGLGRTYEAEDVLDEANRYYALVGLSYDIPELSPAALRKAAETFERMGRPEDRDKILNELRERYPE